MFYGKFSCIMLCKDILLRQKTCKELYRGLLFAHMSKTPNIAVSMDCASYTPNKSLSMDLQSGLIQHSQTPANSLLYPSGSAIAFDFISFLKLMCMGKIRFSIFFIYKNYYCNFTALIIIRSKWGGGDFCPFFNSFFISMFEKKKWGG